MILALTRPVPYRPGNLLIRRILIIAAVDQLQVVEDRPTSALESR